MQQESTSVRRGNRRLIVVLALAAFLIVQGAYAFVAPREPFPAIVMPGFGTSSDTDGNYSVTFLDITVDYDDGSVAHPRYDELLSDFRFSASRPSVGYMFDPDRNSEAGSPPPAVVDWLRERASSLGDGRIPEKVTFCWMKNSIDLSTAEATPIGECRTTEVTL